MEIDRTSRRILGALIEKRWTTPEQYPLTVNSLVLACNQKSNRDPETNYEQPFVEGCLYQLRLADLVMVVERDTGRATRYAERMAERLGKQRVRINKSGCLGQCGHGPMVAVYPENVWYAHVRAEDAAEIVDSHLVRGVLVERLLFRGHRTGTNAIVKE